jgi:hypothetical protein
LDVQEDLASVDEMESGDADLIVHEEVPSTQDEVLKNFFRKWKNSLQPKS